MPYVAIVQSIEDRTARIDQAEPTGNKGRIFFRGANRDLDVKRVPASSLLYRVSNIRTIVRQRELVMVKNVDPSFFSAGEENDLTQQAQHEILLEMSKDSTADIYSKLRQSAEQRDPLLVTVRGVVVNGNRRLSAMRDLHAEDPGRFNAFTHVEVAVLPTDTNDDDLSEIETRLQIAPDLRSEYGWIEEALGLQDQTETRGWSLERAASIWDVPISQLRERLDHLRLADQYLEFRGTGGDYKSVAGDKQAFESFTKVQKGRISRNAPIGRLEAEKLVMFAVLGHEVAYRKYDYANQIESITREIEIMIGTTVTPETTPNVVTDNSADPLAALEAPVDEVEAGLLVLLRDKEYSKDLSEMAEQALADLKSRQSAIKRGSQLTDAVRQSLAKLSGLTLTGVNPETYAKALISLISLQCQVARLIKLLIDDKPALPGEIDLAVINQLREVTAVINRLNSAAA